MTVKCKVENVEQVLRMNHFVSNTCCRMLMKVEKSFNMTKIMGRLSFDETAAQPK